MANVRARTDRSCTPPPARRCRSPSPPAAVARSPTTARLTRTAEELGALVLEDHLPQPDSDLWLGHLHRRAKEHGCVDSAALEQSWAAVATPSAGVPTPNGRRGGGTARQQAIGTLTRAFESTGLHDDWLAHAVSLLDRSRAAAATSASSSGCPPKRGTRDSDLELLAAALIALKHSPMEAEYDKHVQDMVLKLTGSRSPGKSDNSKLFAEVVKKEFKIMHHLDYRIAVPTAHELAKWLAVGACRHGRSPGTAAASASQDGQVAANAGGAETVESSASSSSSSQWRGFQERRLAPSSSGSRSAVTVWVAQPRVVLLAGFLVELAVAHLPLVDLYGSVEDRSDDNMQCGAVSPTLLAFAAAELALAAFGEVPATCREFMTEQRNHLLTPEEATPVAHLMHALRTLWLRPPEWSDVMRKWRSREALRLGGELPVSAPVCIRDLCIPLPKADSPPTLPAPASPVTCAAEDKAGATKHPGSYAAPDAVAGTPPPRMSATKRPLVSTPSAPEMLRTWRWAALDPPCLRGKSDEAMSKIRRLCADVSSPNKIRHEASDGVPGVTDKPIDSKHALDVAGAAGAPLVAAPVAQQPDTAAAEIQTQQQEVIPAATEKQQLHGTSAASQKEQQEVIPAAAEKQQPEVSCAPCENQQPEAIVRAIKREQPGHGAADQPHQAFGETIAIAIAERTITVEELPTMTACDVSEASQAAADVKPSAEPLGAEVVKHMPSCAGPREAKEPSITEAAELRSAIKEQSGEAVGDAIAVPKALAEQPSDSIGLPSQLSRDDQLATSADIPSGTIRLPMRPKNRNSEQAPSKALQEAEDPRAKEQPRARQPFSSNRSLSQDGRRLSPPLVTDEGLPPLHRTMTTRFANAVMTLPATGSRHLRRRSSSPAAPEDPVAANCRPASGLKPWVQSYSRVIDPSPRKPFRRGRPSAEVPAETARCDQQSRQPSASSRRVGSGIVQHTEQASVTATLPLPRAKRRQRSASSGRVGSGVAQHTEQASVTATKPWWGIQTRQRSASSGRVADGVAQHTQQASVTAAGPASGSSPPATQRQHSKERFPVATARLNRLAAREAPRELPRGVWGIITPDNPTVVQPFLRPAPAVLEPEQTETRQRATKTVKKRKSDSDEDWSPTKKPKRTTVRKQRSLGDASDTVAPANAAFVAPPTTRLRRSKDQGNNM